MSEVRNCPMDSSDKNERLAHIISHVPSGIAAFLVKDRQPLSVIINNYLAAHLGIMPGKIELSSVDQVMDYIHPDDRNQCLSHFNAILQGLVMADGEYRLREAVTGGYRWMHMVTTIDRRDDGIDVLYVSYTDVTSLKEKEKALEEIRQMYDETALAAHLIMWEYDIAKHRIIMANNVATKSECQRFNWPMVIDDVPEVIIPFIDEADVSKLLEMYEKVEAGLDATCDLWYKEQPGQEPRCERLTYRVVRDSQGLPVKAYGLGRNITAEKKVAERYAQAIIDLDQYQAENLIAKGHSSLTQNKVLSYTIFNELAYKSNGTDTYDEGCERYLTLAYNDTERRQLRELISRENLIRRYLHGEMTTSFKYRRLQKNEAPIWVSTVIHTYMRPDTGDLECFSYTYDVSARALEEEVVAKLAELGFDELGLIYPDTGLWTCYRFSRQQGTQNLWESQGSYNDDLARYLRDEVIPEQREEARQMLTIEHIVAALTEHEVFSFTNTVSLGDGSTGQKHFRMSWLDEKKDAIFYCMSDVTQQFAHENEQIASLAAAKLAAEQANEAKSSFLSSISHDLRTPLNGIIGFTNVAIKETDPIKQHEYLEKVQASANLLLDLINDTLELSRIESGKMKLDQEVVLALSLVTPVVTALRPTAELKNIHIEVDLSELPDELLLLDKLKTQKVMLNLLSNAIKYTPSSGQVKLIVRKLTARDNGYTHSIIVEDNGIGMNPEFQQHLFEPFTQEKRQETKKITGTGLGLAIVKRIVALMDGKIVVESEVGKGSRFTVNLPIQSVEGAYQQAEETQINTDEVLLEGKRILLVEDNSLNAEIATVLLREKGMVVDVASNGQEGLETFAKAVPETYAAILMDIRMPVMDGYEATKAIRGLINPDGQAIPIIALTADAFEEDIHQFEEVGMNGYVLKPVNPVKLVAALVKSINQ